MLEQKFSQFTNDSWMHAQFISHFTYTFLIFSFNAFGLHYALEHLPEIMLYILPSIRLESFFCPYMMSFEYSVITCFDQMIFPTSISFVAQIKQNCIFCEQKSWKEVHTFGRSLMKTRKNGCSVWVLEVRQIWWSMASWSTWNIVHNQAACWTNQYFFCNIVHIVEENLRGNSAKSPLIILEDSVASIRLCKAYFFVHFGRGIDCVPWGSKTQLIVMKMIETFNVGYDTRVHRLLKYLRSTS